MKQSFISYQDVPRETFESTDRLISAHEAELDTYLDRLLWWNQRVNLVSRTVPRETIREHIRHSLLIHRFEDFHASELIVDTGTGGGLPGIPLAICHPEKQFVLNDIVTKKMLAVKQMVQHLGLQNVTLADGSVSRLRLDDPCLLVSKHSFKIPEILQLARSLPWTGMVLYKGEDFRKEAENLPDEYSATAYGLHRGSELDFYRGKALVFIRRTGVE